MCNILGGKWKKTVTLCNVRKNLQYMNRLFNAKIEPGSFLLLALVLAATVFLMWTSRNGIVIMVMLLLMVVMIERVIHTNYTVTHDGKLIIHTGRFSKDKMVELSQVKGVERMAGMCMFGKALRTFVVIECFDGRVFSLIPREEEKFLKCVRQRLDEN